MRLFLGIPIPKAHKRSIEKAIEPLRHEITDARWVPRENWHATVKFLGNTDDHRFDEVIEVAKAAALKTKRFSTHLGKFGCFSSCRRARVLWVSLYDPDDVMAYLAARLDKKLGKLGFRKESRKLRPHITVGRLRQPRSVEQEVQAAGPFDLDDTPFEISEIVAYESHLSPKGATYTEADRVPLG